jgi:hypothetical protein
MGFFESIQDAIVSPETRERINREAKKMKEERINRIIEQSYIWEDRWFDVKYLTSEVSRYDKQGNFIGTEKRYKHRRINKRVRPGKHEGEWLDVDDEEYYD